jgi:hypothetical protein
VRVFISWSGHPARDIAMALSSWPPTVVQSVESWHSDKDVGTGRRERDQEVPQVAQVPKISSVWLMSV